MKSNKMKVLSLIVIVSIAFGAGSCKKKNDFSPKNNTENKEKRVGFTLNYSNSSNAYDDRGERHNFILTYLEENNGIDKSLLATLQLIENHDWELTDSIPWEDTIYSASAYLYRDFVDNDLETASNDLNTFFDDEYDNGHYSIYVRDYLKDINDEISTNMSCTSCSLQVLVQDKLDNIKDIESDINSDSNLDADEKEWLLACASVTRHSFSFWINHARDSSNPWNIEDIADTGDLDIAYISVVLAADLTGAHMAYQSGAIFWGASFGPGGALAVLGGMAGGASAIAAIWG